MNMALGFREPPERLVIPPHFLEATLPVVEAHDRIIQRQITTEWVD